MFLSTQALFPLKLCSLCCNIFSFTVAIHHIKLIACLWSAIQTQDQSRSSRPHFFNLIASFVIHSLNMSKTGACKHNISDSESAGFNQDRSEERRVGKECRS